MLDDIERDTSKETKNTVAIAIDDDFAAIKSYAHNSGDRVPKREFFGITRSEAEKIANEIKEESPQGERITLADLRAAVAALGIEQEE